MRIGKGLVLRPCRASRERWFPAICFFPLTVQANRPVPDVTPRNEGIYYFEPCRSFSIKRSRSSSTLPLFTRSRLPSSSESSTLVMSWYSSAAAS
jgi:hypothetical protein